MVRYTFAFPHLGCRKRDVSKRIQDKSIITAAMHRLMEQSLVSSLTSSLVSFSYNPSVYVVSFVKRLFGTYNKMATKDNSAMSIRFPKLETYPVRDEAICRSSLIAMKPNKIVRSNHSTSVVAIKVITINATSSKSIQLAEQNEIKLEQNSRQQFFSPPLSKQALEISRLRSINIQIN